ncbi:MULTISPECIES: DUF1259 domain-containing protein [Peribacillus]|uniref:DUF1259 domain-containing protein n=1 Tax=Peribacillus TaxID=2675229 RepID=UPI002161880E|nr:MULTISPECIES: DUF1259 domain-containing protein [Peribacillus]
MFIDSFFISIEKLSPLNKLRALCLGRVALLQKEVENFVASILKQGIIVSSIHNEWLFDNPNLVYVNIEAVDDPLVFARKVRKALRN